MVGSMLFIFYIFYQIKIPATASTSSAEILEKSIIGVPMRGGSFSGKVTWGIVQSFEQKRSSDSENALTL